MEDNEERPFASPNPNKLDGFSSCPNKARVEAGACIPNQMAPSLPAL
jgi:hypothetical protein